MYQLRAGVVGAGVFGRFHARKYASSPGVRLVGVYDHHFEHAEQLGRAFGVQAFEDLGALLAAADVVSIASPAATHAEMAERALAAGRHVYVEKPLATTQADGQALVDHARDRRLVLACGHQERVIFQAMGLITAPQTPRRIESVRRGPPNARNRDVSCVLDLMIHDLDLALTFGRDGVLDVQAEGDFDEARAEITFRGGMKAVLSASRRAERRERTMRLDYGDGVVEADFLIPALRNTAPFALNADFAETPQGRDPLGASIAGFLMAVHGVVMRPVVTGEDGLAALQLALAVERAVGIAPA